MSESTPELCELCWLPMHRFGFPADWNKHKPSWVACLNSLRDEVKELREENSWLKEKMERVHIVEIPEDTTR